MMPVHIRVYTSAAVKGLVISNHGNKKKKKTQTLLLVGLAEHIKLVKSYLLSVLFRVAGLSSCWYSSAIVNFKHSCNILVDNSE